MRTLAERAWFRLCLVSGRLLRAGRYSRTGVAEHGGARQVRKQRVPVAPMLVWMGGPLMRVLGTGVRVLPQRDWEQRERELYRSLYGTAVGIDRARTGARTLVLPFLPGETLAALLEDTCLNQQDRRRATELAVAALARLHEMGWTHGDAMAENVMIDLDTGVAAWFDFETIHDPRRALAWRRADDLRALLATCLLRTPREYFAGTIAMTLDVYGDGEVARLLAAGFNSVFQRPLIFHLGQAALPLHDYREIGRLLRERTGR